jgi:hypothetical protein
VSSDRLETVTFDRVRIAILAPTSSVFGVAILSAA